jgi:RNA polymerase sigma-70 factor (ECF subfamily)
VSFSWSALHAHLLSQSCSLQFEEDYRRLRASAPEALLAVEVPALLSFLHSPTGDPEAKNMALRAIVAAMQADDRKSQSLTTLLLLALWPGMDAVRGRLLRFFRNRSAELDADLMGRMAIAIGDLDLTRVRRIAATLLRNLERDLRRDLKLRTREVLQECLTETLADDGQMMFAQPLQPFGGC